MPLIFSPDVPVVPPLADPLVPYQPSAAIPWTAERVAHVYRRLGFGATFEQIQQGLALSPDALIDLLLDDVAIAGPPNPPYWGGWTLNDYENANDPNLVFEHRNELRRRWLQEMLEEGIRPKMALFWHNHFVTELDVYGCNAYLWTYFSQIHDFAFGNFRTFAREMGKTGAMLVYLNGNENFASEPNENYARELMELFTMGESNGYTQTDIVEMARALTGWRASGYYCEPPYFDANQHDNTPKTIFGQTANYTYTTAHNLIFTERAEQVAHFIAGKIYRYFVYQHTNNEVVSAMAQTLRDNNWEMLPMLKQLFKSEHFYTQGLLSAQLKAPLELLLQTWKSAGIDRTMVPDNWWDRVAYWSYQLGQDMFDPPNVAGWKGYHTWINESTLAGRWDICASSVGFFSGEEPQREKLRNLAINLTNNSNDPAIITAALVSHFTGQQLDPVYLQAAIINFKAGVPENYYDDGSWNLSWNEAPYQIINLLLYLVRMPEFQLT